jgi:hypothetical protein
MHVGMIPNVVKSKFLVIIGFQKAFQMHFPFGQKVEEFCYSSAHCYQSNRKTIHKYSMSSRKEKVTQNPPQKDIHCRDLGT